LRYRVSRVEIPIPGSPGHWNEVRIAPICDIHLGYYFPARELRRVVDLTNALRPELVVVTGDFITDEHDPLDACVAELGRLRAPLGVWACNGNHELFAELDDETRPLFARFGMNLLRQENVAVTIGGERRLTSSALTTRCRVQPQVKFL
jgi:predicted MPP superfamily phosphohydrolase